jgi:ATP-dependent DNA helicase RecQ
MEPTILPIPDRWPDRPTDPDWSLVKRGLGNMSGVLAQMGYSKLRDGQEPVIMSIMAQVDTICILPTGTGKTACFAIPTMSLNWRTIVFSPLVALMRDQVKGLHRMNFPAAAMSGMQTDGENADAARRWQEGELNFLYVAPERLHNEIFKQAVGRMPPDFVVLDEAHTLSQWSDNFRSSYCKVGDFVREINPKVVLACTATCPKHVEQDIRRVLGLSHAKKLIHYPRRTNLDLRSDNLASEHMITETLLGVRGSGGSIVYCATIKRVEELAETLSKSIRGKDVLIFHGELSDATKRNNQDAFMEGHADIIVSTNAFGMGVDKPDVRCVIHRDFPGTVEALAQEVGRAGRDGLPSLCMTYFSQDSLDTQYFFLKTGHPPVGDIQRVYHALLSMADSSGICRITGDDVATRANVSKFGMRAIFETLKGANVIQREHVDQKICKVRETNISVPADNERFHDYMQLAEQMGVPTGDGFIEFDMADFASSVSLGYPTVRNWFKKWAQAGWIRFVDPYVGSETRVIGDLSQVDFPRLEFKREEAYRKLDDMLKYVNLPDSEKHAFIENYFEVHEK